MSNQERKTPRSTALMRRYEIRVKSHLSSTWSDWLGGLEVKLLDNGETILRGQIVDQAALMGILNKLDRLNLTLLSVARVTDEECGGPDVA